MKQRMRNSVKVLLENRLKSIAVKGFQQNRTTAKNRSCKCSKIRYNKSRFMNNETLQHIFLTGAGLLPDNADDAICIGTMLPHYSPDGMERVMQAHTHVIDSLLELSAHSSLVTVQLLSIRGITFYEYKTVLFDLTISDFGNYPALRCFFFSSNKERKEKVIYQYNRNSHADHKTLLVQMLQFSRPHVFSFLFSDES